MSQANTELELVPGNVKEATKDIKSNDLWQVPFDDLYIIPGYNVREETAAYLEHIQNLKRSIMANGYDRTQPMAGFVIKVDGRSRIAVTAGHSRYRAVALAREEGYEVHTIPVVTSPRGTSTEDLQVQLVTSNTGSPLKPYEVGTVIKRLLSGGLTIKQVAERLAITEFYANDLLKLHEAPAAVRELVRLDKVSATLAIETLKKHGPEDAAAILKDAVTVAEASGKKKASAKHVADDWNKVFRKRSLDLYEAALVVYSDSGFQRLTKAAQTALAEVLDSLPKRPKPKAKPAKGKAKE